MVLPSTINEKNVDKVLKFIQTMYYYGMGDESAAEKGVRIYKQNLHIHFEAKIIY